MQEWLLNCRNSSMLSRQRLECALLVLLVALSRYLFRSHYLYDLDSVNFALGIGRFDPAVHQPHPPGYFLYIWLARSANTFFHDPNAALVAISLLASCGAAAMVYLLTWEWFGGKAAVFAGLIFLVSPLTWFHGTVALIYMVEGFLSALLGYLCWRMHCGKAAYVFPAAMVLGLGAGIRPSFSLFLAPLFLFSLRKVPPRKALAGIGCLLLAVLAWFLPMVEASGGFQAYFSSLFSLWRVAGGRETVFNSSPFTSLARILAIILAYIICFGSAVLFSGRFFDKATPQTRYQRAFTLIWIVPGLLFFSFIFLIFVNSGYLLVIFPPLFAWLGLWTAEWYARLQWPAPLKNTVVALLAAINVLVFLEASAYCTNRSVRQFEAEIEDLRQSVRRIASPQQTLIVGFDSHFLGYRHAGYYLPDYSVAQYPEVRFAFGQRVFFMRNRNTQLRERLEAGQFTNFLLFPLPSDEEAYRKYFAKIKAKFPPGDLRTVHAGHHDFVFAPIADLPYLFPDAASPALYTAHHAADSTVYSR